MVSVETAHSDVPFGRWSDADQAVLCLFEDLLSVINLSARVQKTTSCLELLLIGPDSFLLGIAVARGREQVVVALDQILLFPWIKMIHLKLSASAAVLH